MEVCGCCSPAVWSPSPFDSLPIIEDSLPIIEEVRHLPGSVRRDLIRRALIAIRQYLGTTSDRLRRHGNPCSACVDRLCGAVEASDVFTKKLDEMIEAKRLASRPKRPREEEREEEDEWELNRRRPQFRRVTSSNVVTSF